MDRLHRIVELILILLIASLPFDFRSFPVMSNLQWLLVAGTALALPILLRDRKKLFQDRLVRMALLFVATQWLAALLADQFNANAIRGAVRATAGFMLLCMVPLIENRKRALVVWAGSTVAAAVYAVLDYNGLGWPELFRDEQFYVGPALRLSGSFEYPNTAAAFFALSLPVVWVAARSWWTGIAAATLIWIVLLLTYSRGAMIAVLAVLAIWMIAQRSRTALLLGAACVVAFGVVLLFHPYLLQRLQKRTPDRVLAAEYTPEFNRIEDRPGARAEMRIGVKNIGADTWFPTGDQPVSISYRWYDPGQGIRIRVNQIHTPVPHSVTPGELVELRAPFNMPRIPGQYVLVFELARRGDGWFNTPGMFPGIIEANIDDSNEASKGNGDVTRWYRPEHARMYVADVPIERADLWRAAVGLTAAHPVLGIGPDNFRLRYGEWLQLERSDTQIRSNNLYLELLSGSGVLGLISFAAMIAAIPRKAGVVTFALGVFLIHGLVDVFLMTTPIYFPFWILLGFARCSLDLPLPLMVVSK